MAEIINSTSESLDSDYEKNIKAEREGIADQIQRDLTEAQALLNKAKSEMTEDDLENAWQSMQQVEQITLGLHNNSERLRIKLRLEAEQKNRK